MLETEEKPPVTFALFTYNQERYIAEAVTSAFAQVYSSLQIILSDDYSTDSTFEIMSRMAAEYRGPHKIILNRNSKNLGLSAHVNRIMKLAQTQFVVLAAGDDISLPTRTADSVRALMQTGSPMISLSTVTFFPDGRSRVDNTRITAETITLDGYLTRKNRHPPGAARAIHRKLFTTFGPLGKNCPTEDTTLLIRALLLGDVYYIPELGVRYRRHSDAISLPENLLKMDIAQIEVQYLVDAKRANELNLISDQTYLNIESILHVRNAKRVKVENLRKTGSFTNGLLPITCDANFSLREKLSSTKQYLLAKARKYGHR